MGYLSKISKEHAMILYVFQWRPLTENEVKYLREKAIETKNYYVYNLIRLVYSNWSYI